MPTLDELVAEKVREAMQAPDEQVRGPSVPKVDHMPQTPEEVQELSRAFAKYREEVQALRNELASSRGRPPVTTIAPETMEDRMRKRLEEIAQHSHYCPGCGQLYDYPQKCEGTVEGPHKPLEVVGTDELSGDPLNHTAAPSTEPALV